MPTFTSILALAMVLLPILPLAFPITTPSTSALDQLTSYVTDALKCGVCSSRVLHGAIEGCCCSAETATQVNTKTILPTLTHLTQRVYFKYYKVSLEEPCHFWPGDSGMCMREDCSVCECPANEVPQCWDEPPNPGSPRSSAVQVEAAGGEGPGGGREEGWSQSTGGGGGSLGGALFSPGAVWTVPQQSEGDYVNLLDNPEGYTGYGTTSEDRGAQEVWAALYAEACFEEEEGEGDGKGGGTCLEERVFYRLLSGLHASISTHIALTAGVTEATGLVHTTPLAPLLTPHFAPSVKEYIERVGGHEERLSNLYFTFTFVARAVAKAKGILSQLNLTTGIAGEDEATRELLHTLLEATSSPDGLGSGFDETRLFNGGGTGKPPAPPPTPLLSPLSTSSSSSSTPSCPATGGHPGHDLAVLEARHASSSSLLSTYRSKYQNISRVLDCVGCDRCRLWGKLQFLGLGTAMKVLFADAEARFAGVSSTPTVHLTRNEVVALINVFHRLSISVAAVEVMRDLELAGVVKEGGGVVAGGVLVVVGVLVWALLRCTLCRKGAPKEVEKVGEWKGWEGVGEDDGPPPSCRVRKRRPWWATLFGGGGVKED